MRRSTIRKERAGVRWPMLFSLPVGQHRYIFRKGFGASVLPVLSVIILFLVLPGISALISAGSGIMFSNGDPHKGNMLWVFVNWLADLGNIYMTGNPMKVGTAQPYVFGSIFCLSGLLGWSLVGICPRRAERRKTDCTRGFMHLSLLLLFLVPEPVTCTKAMSQGNNYKQTGHILLYQGRYNTSPFTQLANITFGNTPTTRSDSKGTFTIDCQLLRPGQNLGECRIETRPEYLLFNKREVSNWILPTVRRDMEVLLCTQSYINRIENAYVSSQEAQLKKEIRKQKEELVKAYEKEKKLTAYNQELDMRLKNLDEKYRTEIDNIKKRATLFAYVDERNIDSLEYAFRQCILSGDMELAMKLGHQLTEDSLISTRIQNARTAVDKAVLEVQKLRNLVLTQETYLQACQMVMADENGHFDNEEQCYTNLIRIYEELIELHGPNKMNCDSQTMKEWKRRLGKIYHDRAHYDDHADYYIHRSAELGYPSALLELSIDEDDYSLSQKLLHDCIEVCQDSVIDDMDMDFLQNLYESYPDFFSVQKGDTLYFHILNDKEVSLVFFVHGNKSSTEVAVPEKVKHNGVSYKVTKIGMNAFGNLKYWASSETNTTLLGLFKDNSPFSLTRKWNWESDYLGTDSLTRIRLPNSITYIGSGAFMNLLDPPCLTVNMPKDIKTIKHFAFLGCKHENPIVIPEGAISVSMAWMGDSINLELPSSLRELEDFDDHNFISRGYMTFSDIKVHPDNPYLKEVNGVVYKKDGSELYSLSMLRTNGSFNLFIPKDLHRYLDRWYDINAFLLPDTISIEDGCRNYSLYHGVLYNHTLDTLILRPKSVENIILPPTFKCQLSPYNFANCRSLYIPHEIPAPIFWDVLDNNDFSDESKIVYEAIKEPDILNECMQLARNEFESAQSPYDYNQNTFLSFHRILKGNGYKKEAEEINKLIEKIKEQRAAYFNSEVEEETGEVTNE